MATFTKDILSGSSDGRSIPVAATTSPGTTIHTGPTSTSEYHEVWLYIVNGQTTAVQLTLQWGNTSTDDAIEVTIPAQDGLYQIIPGLVLKGNATPKVVRAYAATGSVLFIHGYVNKIT